MAAPLASTASLTSTSSASTPSSEKSNASLPEVLPSAELKESRDDTKRLKASHVFLRIGEQQRRRSSIGVSRSDPSFDHSFQRENVNLSHLDKPKTAKKQNDVSADLLATPPPPTSSSRRRSRATWRLRLQAPGMALQAQILRERVRNMSNVMAKLRDASDDLSEYEGISTRRRFEDVALSLNKAGSEVFEGILICLRESVSSRRLNRLKNLNGRQGDPVTADISVRFFGLDWGRAGGLMAQLATSVEKICAAAVRNNASSEPRPSPTMINLLSHTGAHKKRRSSNDAEVMAAALSATRILNELREDVTSHAEAVLAGRLNQRRNDRIW